MLYDVEGRPTRFQLLDIVPWLSRISTAEHKNACVPLPDCVYGDDGVGKYGVVPCTLELGVALIAVPKLAPPPEIPCELLARATDNFVGIRAPDILSEVDSRPTWPGRFSRARDHQSPTAS
jgi:hypothetical protein